MAACGEHPVNIPKELMDLCTPVSLPCQWCGAVQDPMPGPVILFACRRCNPESLTEEESD
jgi:hypothetical protein